MTVNLNEEIYVASACGNEHGEGVIWNARQQALYWTDIQGKKLWRLKPATKEVESFAMPERLCAFAIRADGSLLAAFASGLAFYSLENGEREDFYAFEPDQPNTRLNDGACDRQGRFIVGGNDESGEDAPISSVIQVDTDGSVRTLMENLVCTNSLSVSPEGTTLYVADTPSQQILAYQYDAKTGDPQAARVFANDAPQGMLPDGSTVDAEGYLWNAQWGGSRVVRYSPAGQVDRVVEVPVPNPTCVAFGGENMDTLFITTSTLGLTAAELAAAPLSGHLLAIKTDVQGLPEPEFAG